MLEELFLGFWQMHFHKSFKYSYWELYSLSPLSELLCKGEIYPQPRPNTPW
jgi:hypothetical protein